MAVSVILPDQTGSTTDYAVPFEYLSRSHVKATVDGAPVPFTFNSTYIIRISPAPVGSVAIYRETPSDEPINVFTDGSILVADELNAAFLQSLFVSQEVTDKLPGRDSTGSWDFDNRRLANVAEPEFDNDAATVGWVKAQYNSGVDAQVARFASEAARDASQAAQAAAETEADAASVSETSAATSASQASTQRSQAEVARTGAEAARDAAITARDTAQGYRDTALEHRNAAAGSASTATTKAAEASASAAAAAASNPANLVRHDAPQTLTLAQRGQARANIGGGVLAGFRNKIINGNFDRDLWQRGTSLLAAVGSRFCADRWNAIGIGSTTTVLRVAFAPGQTDVPGEPEFFHRIGVSSVAGAGNAALLRQNIEGVRTLAGKLTTRTFYMKADAPRTVACEVVQVPGTGGSPSAQVVGIGVQKFNLTTQWQRFDVVVALPSISGMVLGTNLNDAVQLNWWFDAGSSFNSRTGSLGQQSGTFDIARVSFVEGDATAEDDPFSPRHSQQELALCQRYYEVTQLLISAGHDAFSNSQVTWTFRNRKRAQPSVAADWNSAVPNGLVVSVDSCRFSGGASFFQAANQSARADAEL